MKPFYISIMWYIYISYGLRGFTFNNKSWLDSKFGSFLLWKYSEKQAIKSPNFVADRLNDKVNIFWNVFTFLMLFKTTPTTMWITFCSPAIPRIVWNGLAIHDMFKVSSLFGVKFVNYLSIYSKLAFSNSRVQCIDWLIFNFKSSIRQRII